MTRRPRRNSRRPRRPTRCSPTRDKRAAYDRYGHAGVDPNSAAPARGMGGFAEAFGDIFGDIFGGGGGSAAARGGPQVYRGADLRYSMDVTLEQAAHGYDTQISIPSWVELRDLPRLRREARHEAAGLPDVLGVRAPVRMQQGFFSIQQTCPRCHGTGKIIPEPCATCDGAGKIKSTKTLEVKIPAGIDDGMRIRSSGNGEPGVNGGPNGDLYVEIHIKPHPMFQRDGDDLHCEMPISFATAALGGELEIPTLDGQRGDHDPRRHAERQDVPPARQGHQGRAVGLSGRPLLPRRGRDAGAS